MMVEKELPVDISAERYVLGACLLERDAILEARKQVSVGDFHEERQRQKEEQQRQEEERRNQELMTWLRSRIIEALGGEAMSNQEYANNRQPDYARIYRAPLPGDYYFAWHRGDLVGIFSNWQDAFDALWQGPITDDLIHYQNELYIKRIVQRNAEQLRKALELEQQDG